MSFRPKRRSGVLIKLIMAALLLGTFWSCAKPQLRPPEGFFYVLAEHTYLRDNPGYNGNVLGMLYKGDEVKRLDVGASGWCRVELLRSGQEGWVPQELLSSEPVGPVFYYVSEDSLPMLECPRGDCLPLQVLFRGEPVQRVEEGNEGWWRVLVLKSRSLGWVPAAALADSLEEAQARQLPKPFYYVAVRKLKLLAKPSPKSEVVRTLRFNDQVQKLEENPAGWLKVRQPATGAMGWVSLSDLETLPLISPKGEPPGKDQLRPFKEKAEPHWEPEFM
jgi:uncharacterized protein YgiM (DUF1202 family)